MSPQNQCQSLVNLNQRNQNLPHHLIAHLLLLLHLSDIAKARLLQRAVLLVIQRVLLVHLVIQQALLVLVPHLDIQLAQVQVLARLVIRQVLLVH